METKITREHLELFKIFKGVADDVVNGLTEGLPLRIRPARAGLYYPGDTSDTIYFLVEGMMKVGRISFDGREVIKKMVQPGDMFGELSVTGESAREEFAVPTRFNAIFFAVKAADFRAALSKDKVLMNNFIEALGSRLNMAGHKIERYVLDDSRTRIIDFILETVSNGSTNERGELVGYHYMTHQDIANLTGASRQFVTSLLNGLRKDGMIDFNRFAFMLKSKDKLIHARNNP